MTGAPYRASEFRPESTPLRRSWSGLATSVLFTASLGAYAYVLLRYVAGGWVGQAIAAMIAAIAVLSVREIGGNKRGACPRCAADVATSRTRAGYFCRSCTTFLEVDRGQLLASPEDRVATRCCFGVKWDAALVLPDRCCVCQAPSVRHELLDVGGEQVEVPYCAAHARGALARPGWREIRFRSLRYATAVRAASGGRFIGNGSPIRDATDPFDRKLERSFFFAVSLVCGALALASYYGLAAYERADYVIVPTSFKGALVWLAITLIGRLWLTAILGGVAVVSLWMWIGSLKRRRA